jgi:MATE family multidrug resistance protein
MMDLPARTGGARGAAWRAELAAMLALAWPLVLTNLSQFALTLTDTIFIGRLGTVELAAATLGANLFFAALAPCFGLAMAAAPMTAQTRGRGRGFVRGMRRDLRAAFWAIALATIPIWALLWQTGPLLLLLGQEPALASLAAEYVRALMWGMPCFCLMVALRGFLSAEQRPGAALVVSILAILLNIPLNLWLIHGGLGLPPLGVAGAGIASSLCNLAMLLGLIGLIARDRHLRRFRVLGRFWRADLPRLKEAFVLGLPIAGAMLLEIGVFAFAAIAMGWLGALAVAAHAIAIQVASATFMVPMGLGQAATARVGLATGAGDRAAAALAGWVAIGLGTAFMAGSALMLVGFAGPIAWVFLDPANPGAAETAALAATLLVMAGLFQLADGVQAVAGGALRGFKDTTVPMLLAGGGYWLAGLPLGLVLAFPAGLGPLGLWIGLAAGLFLVAGLMTARWVALSAPPRLTPRPRPA